MSATRQSSLLSTALLPLVRIVIISRAVLQCRHLDANKETGSCRTVDYFTARFYYKTIRVSDISTFPSYSSGLVFNVALLSHDTREM